MLRKNKKRRMIVNPNDFADMLRLKDEYEVDIAFKAASTISSLINYLREGDAISISGMTFLKTSETSFEIFNNLDNKDLLELIAD